MMVADPPSPLELELDAVANSVPRARRAAAEYADQAGAERKFVELAVAEAVANCVLHAYPGRDAGTVGLKVWIDDDVLVVVVTDDGAGIRPHPDGGGLGLGLAIIGQLSSGFSVTRPPEGGTALRMTFPLTSVEAGRG